MLEAFFLDLQPKTELQLLIHLHTPLWLLEVPFYGYGKESDDYHDFIKKYENFIASDSESIHWSSTNSYFKEKIEKLIDDLKKNHIDANLPFTKEAIPHIEKIAHSVIDKIKKNLIKTNVSSIIFADHQTNFTALKNISTVFQFKSIHFSAENFYFQKSKLEAEIDILTKKLINQVVEKRPLVDFFSSDLERISERLKPVTKENLPLLDSYKIPKPFEKEIIQTYELKFNQKKLLSDYKEFLEKKQKSLCHLMTDIEIKFLFTELLNKMQKVEMAWENTLATSSDLELLLKLEEPLKNIISTLEKLKKMNNIQFTPLIEEHEKSLENIDLILKNKNFFQLVYIKEQRIPLGLIGLFLNRLKIPANRLGHELAVFQLNKIGLIEACDQAETLVLLENTTVNEALNNCSSHAGKATYHAIKDSNIVDHLKKLITSIEAMANNVFKSNQERKKFEEHYQLIQHSTPPHLDLTDLNTKPLHSKNISKKKVDTNEYFTPARTLEELEQQPSLAPEYVPSIFPNIIIPQQPVSSFLIPSTEKYSEKTNDSSSDVEPLNSNNNDSGYSGDEDIKKKKSELTQLAESKPTPIYAPRPSIFSPPPLLVLNSKAREKLFQAAQHFLETIILSASNKKVELENSDSHVPNAIKFLSDLIEEQKGLLNSLDKESPTFLQDIENLLAKDDIEKCVGINKCLTRNVMVERWLENLIHSPAYKEARQTLNLAVSTAEHRGRLVFSG